ncbi:MAG: hypothetical protein LBI99_06545 [Propionibacteriaceae bacterium]|jgi:hypothetical protein|nr:hypothetical protein [Propionibacteriaceae bacterium]
METAKLLVKEQVMATPLPQGESAWPGQEWTPIPQEEILPDPHPLTVVPYPQLLADHLAQARMDLGLDLYHPPMKMLEAIANLWDCLPQAILDEVVDQVHDFWDSPTQERDPKDVSDPAVPEIRIFYQLATGSDPRLKTT